LNSETVLRERRRIDLEQRGELRDRARLERRIHRRHELAHRLRVDDRKGDLVGLPGDEAAPRSRSAWARTLAFVVEALAVLVDDDAERHRVHARHDAAVEFRRARVDRDAMALRRDR
jgi:hypothetical protein